MVTCVHHKMELKTCPWLRVGEPIVAFEDGVDGKGSLRVRNGRYDGCRWYSVCGPYI